VTGVEKTDDEAWDWMEDQFEKLNKKLDRLQKEVHKMAVDQATFDTELAALVQAITDLDTAVDAFIASQPAGVDLTAEAASVASASAAVAAELAKIAPAPPAPVA
jgi:predicted  nucleic acid-binding Zn-ribbon protein